MDPKSPFTFVDIGAMGGIPKKWNPLHDCMRVLAFEPNKEEFSKLKNTDTLQYLNYLVYDRPQTLELHIAKSPGSSSVLLTNIEELSQFPNTERFHEVKTVSVKSERVNNLDAILQENDIDDIDFVKIDTEGSELAILRGSEEEVLPKVFGLQVEVEFIEKCFGQPLFRDVDDFLAKQGFQIMDLRRQFWKRKSFNDYPGKGQLIFGDALYFKRMDVFEKKLSSLPESGRRTLKLYKSILCCLIYRMFDYAVAIVELSEKNEWLSQEEITTLKNRIQKEARRKQLPFFPGRKKAHALLYRLCEWLKPKSYLGFSDSDRLIGNTKDI